MKFITIPPSIHGECLTLRTDAVLSVECHQKKLILSYMPFPTELADRQNIDRAFEYESPEKAVEAYDAVRAYMSDSGFVINTTFATAVVKPPDMPTAKAPTMSETFAAERPDPPKKDKEINIVRWADYKEEDIDCRLCGSKFKSKIQVIEVGYSGELFVNAHTRYLAVTERPCPKCNTWAREHPRDVFSLTKLRDILKAEDEKSS